MLRRHRPCREVTASDPQRDAGGEFGRWLVPPTIRGHSIGASWLPLPLWPGLRAQLVHSEDVARALQLILTQRAQGPFNLAAGPALTADELAAQLGGPRLAVPRQVLGPLAWLGW